MSLMVTFTGQGSQFVGMGRDLYERSADARRIFAEANDALGFDLLKIMFEGPEETLTLTEYTQPAILTVSYTLWMEMLKEGKLSLKDVKFMAGHSLGEYTALVAAGVMDFKDAVRAVHFRGKFMQEAVEPGKGSMAAVMGVKKDELYAICDEAGHIVKPANFNSPKQIVISGYKEGVDFVVNRLKEQRKRAIPLKVSAPFHSPLMEPASRKMENVLNAISLNRPMVPVIANVTARPVLNPEEIRDLLVKQIHNPVLWDDTVIFAHREGIDRAVEIGPKKVLASLISQTVRDIKVKAVTSYEDILNFSLN